MRINSAIPYFNPDVYQAAASRIQSSASSAQPEKASYYAPGVIVEISQQARDFNNSGKVNPSGAIQEAAGAQEIEGCQTCKSRKYVDQSSDSSVSYQTPTHISPDQAAGKVMAHEREHVTNEQAKAHREDREIVSQSVSLTYDTCPECGRHYVSGGTTRTTSVSKSNTENDFTGEMENESE